MEMKRDIALMFSSLIHGVDEIFAKKFLDKVHFKFFAFFPKK